MYDVKIIQAVIWMLIECLLRLLSPLLTIKHFRLMFLNICYRYMPTRLPGMATYL